MNYGDIIDQFFTNIDDYAVLLVGFFLLWAVEAIIRLIKSFIGV